MTKLETIIEHDSGCCWYQSDEDICNCDLPQKVEQVKQLINEEVKKKVEELLEKVVTKKTGSL